MNKKDAKTQDNTDNGMQAMAVAPMDKDGNVDTSQVVIAYAETNSTMETYSTKGYPL